MDKNELLKIEKNFEFPIGKLGNFEKKFRSFLDSVESGFMMKFIMRGSENVEKIKF